MGRSRGGLTTKIHAVVDAEGRPIRLELTAGQAHGSPLATDLLDDLGEGATLLAVQNHCRDLSPDYGHLLRRISHQTDHFIRGGMKGEVLVAMAISDCFVDFTNDLNVIHRQMRPKHAEFSAHRAIAIDELFWRDFRSEAGGSAMAAAFKHENAG